MTFLIGFIVGSWLGFFIASLCAVSAKADRKDDHE